MKNSNLKYILFITALCCFILASLIAPLNFLVFNETIAIFLALFAMITSLISAFLVLQK